eukprot:417509-Pyramimonas_sp.AAC.1
MWCELCGASYVVEARWCKLREASYGERCAIFAVEAHVSYEVPSLWCDLWGVSYVVHYMVACSPRGLCC